jgi:hypothetical protein
VPDKLQIEKLLGSRVQEEMIERHGVWQGLGARGRVVAVVLVIAVIAAVSAAVAGFVAEGGGGGVAKSSHPSRLR